MYSPEIEQALKKARLKTGDRVAVFSAGRQYEGLLLPRPDIGDRNSIVLKLDSGYNIGIAYAPGSPATARITKSRASAPAAVKEEEDYEVGKVRKGLLKLSFDTAKPAISVIATGGTIASRVDYKTGGVAAVEDPREFLHNVPELASFANIKHIHRPFTKMSEDMDSDDWISLAKVAHAELLKSDIRGLVLTHGTDFLHYTAAALSFFLRNLNKPVILTGAQKSADRGSSDAGMNLVCSARAALADLAEVAICMHASINDDRCLLIRGTRARKMHTVRRDAFRPINSLPLANVWPDGRLEVLNTGIRKRSQDAPALDAKFEPDVALLEAYPGSNPKVIDLLVSEGCRGFVIRGSGLGHVPTLAKRSWIETIRKHAGNGLPFVVTSQTIYGRVNPDVYANLRTLYHEAGAIPGQDMLGETAYVKLGWVLGHTKDPAKIREMMLTNYAGEISERSEVEAFLC